MRWMEWVIAGILILAGLSCLTMASTGMVAGNSLGSIWDSFLAICITIAIPILILVGIYMFYYRRKGK